MSRRKERVPERWEDGDSCGEGIRRNVRGMSERERDLEIRRLKKQMRTKMTWLLNKLHRLVPTAAPLSKLARATSTLPSCTLRAKSFNCYDLKTFLEGPALCGLF